MNMQKILHSYKHWQDYNKQLDIGLMTLYHHQEMTKTVPHSLDAANSLGIESERQKEQFDESLHFQVEAELLQGQERIRGYVEEERKQKKGQPLKLKRLKIGPLMGKKRESSCPLSKFEIPSISRTLRQGLKMGHCDVTQLTNLKQPNHSTNEMPLPMLDRLPQHKKQRSTSEIDGCCSPKIPLQKSLRLITHNSPSCAPKIVLKTAEYITGSSSELASSERSIRTQLKAKKSSKPINYNDYKMISQKQLRHRENNTEGKKYTISLREKLRQESNRYQQTNSSKKPHSKVIQDLYRLKMHCKTLINTHAMEETRLREIISDYFTPVTMRQDEHSLSP